METVDDWTATSRFETLITRIDKQRRQRVEDCEDADLRDTQAQLVQSAIRLLDTMEPGAARDALVARAFHAGSTELMERFADREGTRRPIKSLPSDTDGRGVYFLALLSESDLFAVARRKGLDMSPLFMTLMVRAIKLDDKTLKTFLLSHFAELHTAAGWLTDIDVSDLRRDPAFIQAVLGKVLEVDPEQARIAVQVCSILGLGVHYCALEAAGITAGTDPRDLSRPPRQSAHQRVARAGLSVSEFLSSDAICEAAADIFS